MAQISSVAFNFLNVRSLSNCSGWQTGIQEGAADWDEDWDKFEDEGKQDIAYSISLITTL